MRAELGRRRPAVHDLLHGRAGRLVPADRRLRPAPRLLRRAALGHRPAVDLDQLVDQARRRRAGARDHRGAHAVGVDGLGAQRGDGVLVEVAGQHDPGAGRAQPVELVAGLPREHAEVAGVDADRAELRARGFDRVLDALPDVVGVDQQRGLRAQAADLAAEGRDLVVVQQDVGVGGGARRRDAVAPTRLQVRRRAEPGQVRRAGRGDRGLLVGAPRPHLDQRTARGGGDHPRGRRGHGAVVVEHRQRQRLQHDGVGERAADRQDRRAGEEQLALGVAVDVAGEAVVGEPLDHRPAEHPGQPLQLGLPEPEPGDRLEQPARARHHPVAAAVGQPAGEDLERAPAVGRAVGKSGGDHRQLVVIGEQRGRDRTDRSSGPRAGRTRVVLCPRSVCMLTHGGSP